MLTSLRIQNFRSIRDASVKLGQVNLFIGPNNSGKSNFLKGIELLTRRVEQHNETRYYRKISKEEQETATFFRENLFRKILNNSVEEQKIGFNVIDVDLKNRTVNIVVSLTENALNNNESRFYENENETFAKFDIATSDGEIQDFNNFQKNVSQIIVHRINSETFRFGLPNNTEIRLASDGSNIVSYLFYVGQNYKPLFQRLEADLAQYVTDLVSISTPADPADPTRLKLRFFDQNNIGYWAEEVSEGVLYFLAILCIVHQPDPPKLLLLEEPEKGIHPRRIKEVMDFIFELARLRDIQIILTSHSPYVVDYFADIPECISVFDRENGETVIHNAGDIISETNNRLKAAGGKPIRYTDSLGEHWVSGFLGGVPL